MLLEAIEIKLLRLIPAEAMNVPALKLTNTDLILLFNSVNPTISEIILTIPVMRLLDPVMPTVFEKVLDRPLSL